MSESFDSYKYLSWPTRKLVKSWIEREPEREIPWTLLGRPLTESTVALISTAAVSMRAAQRFDQEGERRNPWWGDPSYRVIPQTATEADVSIDHLHINPKFAERDLDCILPLRRLAELVVAGEVGASAPSHYSFMGYLVRPEQFLAESVPAMIERMQAESVDAAALIPV